MAEMINGWDRRYCYPNSSVLINKHGIQDQGKLQEIERELSFNRNIELKNRPIKGNLDLKHLQNIHKHFFQDIYNWAGEIRTVDIAKGNMFCRSSLIESFAEDIFSKLKKENFLIDKPQERLCERLSFYLGEINALHPFREGNGRTQRSFMENLANVNGYELDFSKIKQKQMIEASVDSFNCEYKKMEDIFKKIMEPITLSEQESYINQISIRNSPITQAYEKKILPIKRDLEKSEYQPTAKLVNDMKKVKESFGEKTIKDIRDLYKNRNNLNQDKKEVLKEVAKDFIEQENAETATRKAPVIQPEP